MMNDKKAGMLEQLDLVLQRLAADIANQKQRAQEAAGERTKFPCH